MIDFHLNTHSGVPAYMQIVQQVRLAVQLRHLRAGDQLPTVRDVVGELAVNPNTVLKAYRELEHQGLTEGRRGQGTFVSKLASAGTTAGLTRLQSDLARWVERARAAGLDDKDIAVLLEGTMSQSWKKGVG